MAFYTDERSLKFQRRWMKSALDTKKQIEEYQLIIFDMKKPKETREALEKEIAILEEYLEDLFAMVMGFRNELSKVLYLKYFEGYTLEEIARMMGYSVNYIYNIHSKFTKYLKKHPLSD